MPYVRRANGREKTVSLRMATLLEYQRSLGRPFFVMLEGGRSNIVIEVGATKREVQQRPFAVATGRMSFREWARRMRRALLGSH